MDINIKYLLEAIEDQKYDVDDNHFVEKAINHGIDIAMSIINLHVDTQKLKEGEK